MVSLSDIVSKQIEELDAQEATLIAEVNRLKDQYWEEVRGMPDFMCRRTFGIAAYPNRFRVFWYELHYTKGVKGRSTYKRKIKLNGSSKDRPNYSQSKTLFGCTDNIHQSLLARYDSPLSEIRELSDRIADSRVVLEKLRARAMVTGR